MKSNKKTSDQQPKDLSNEEKIPLSAKLAIKDLVDPLVIRRTDLLKAGILFILVAGLGFYAWDNFLRQPTGTELLNEMVAAAGGMEAWNNIRHGQFTRTQRLYDESGELLSEKPQTFYFKKTDEGLKLMVKSSTKDGKVAWVGKDAEGFWASWDKEFVDPVETARGLGMMCDSKFCEPLCASSMAFYRFSMPFKLTDYGVRPDLDNKSVFTIFDLNLLNFGTEPIILDVTFKPTVGRDRWKFLVDPEDKLIHKIEYYNRSDMGQERPEEIYWSDHQEEFGITFSHKWTRYWSNGQVMEEYTFTDVDFATELADNFFDRPAGGEWLSNK